LAANGLGFRLVDADQHFYHTTGLSRAKYKSIHGNDQYRNSEMNLLRSMLTDFPFRTVIVCGPGAVEATGRTLVAEFAQSHPVIYIMRDMQGIQQHLRVKDIDKISGLARLSTPTLRSLSHFEFYNLSDLSGDSYGSGIRSPRSLALKQVEYDFIRLIQSIMIPSRDQCSEMNEFRISSVPAEYRSFTYALAIPLSLEDARWANIRQADITADAVELLIPFSDICTGSSGFGHSAADHISRQYYIMRRSIQLPVILHVQLNYDLDISTTSKSQFYHNALRHCMRLAPEYLCVNLACDEGIVRELIASKGRTKIIASYFDPIPSKAGWNAPERREKVMLARRWGADIVRLGQEATTIADNFAVRHFVDELNISEEQRIPIIAYNTGFLGRMSCYLNSILTPVTHPLLQSHEATQEFSALLTLSQAQNALYSSFLLDPLYFGIYGNNVAKSLSPAMHNAAFHFNGMPHKYRVFQHATIQQLGELLNDPTLGGVSVTAPFKREVIPLVDFMSHEARVIGAVNTLIPLRSPQESSLFDRNRAGKTAAVYGDNTDWIGIKSCIRHFLSPINAVRPRTTGLVLGAGGMARAAIYALIQLNVQTIFVHNRTIKGAEALVKQFYGRVCRDSIGPDMSHSSHDEIRPKSQTTYPTIEVIQKKTDAWPENVDCPTIIVSCVATSEVDGQSSVDTSIPLGWLASPTGGVVIEVSSPKRK
jgi:3-dehydroquinate dehydratase type I